MSNIRILVVEDDLPVRNLITTTLGVHGYQPIPVATGREAVREMADHSPEIVLLDLGLPDMDGVEVIRQIRGWSNVPILIISARSEDSDKIEALDAGADDYLTKPFSVDELLARLRVTRRRLALMQGDKRSSTYENGPLTIDYSGHTAELDGQELHLTPIEYKLLCLMAQNTGKVLTHRFLTQSVWGSSWDNNTASLRVYMAALRKKLEPREDSPRFLKTHIGIGYQMLKVE